jgi:hypothetical protein
MVRPPNQQAAAKKARGLLSRRLPGFDPTTVYEHIVRAEHAAEEIWRRWQVGPDWIRPMGDDRELQAGTPPSLPSQLIGAQRPAFA